MFKLSKAQANLYAIITFVLTIILSYYLPEHTITYTGFLLVIFLSVFVNDKKSTVIAAVVAGIIVLSFLLFHPYIDRDAVNTTKHIFVLVLIFFTALIVLHIKRLYSAMSYDKSHMTSLFENATEGIILTNSSGTIILANPAALRMFEYKEQELIGKPVETLLPKRYRTGHVQLRDGFYHAPGNRTMGSGRDLFGQKQNGENFPVEVSLSAYKQSNDQFVIAFIVDITHRKEIAAAGKGNQRYSQTQHRVRS
jgi:PAS domain S-box-containing protein